MGPKDSTVVVGEYEYDIGAWAGIVYIEARVHLGDVAFGLVQGNRHSRERQLRDPLLFYDGQPLIEQSRIIGLLQCMCTAYFEH